VESPWWQQVGYGWVLLAPIQLKHRVQCRGRQGLWTVPQFQADEIRRQLERHDATT
jgi:hypothetical protein